ncbi:protein PAXX isoform X2 [Gymnogyps californianus]|uniref:protein PAXX isoform X2 n=1 Tax=Gymnogyps californianus TaxID=33616 RepID=UPI0021C75345|nr:protein PAXX isoform X2 [Gymnogyps californianus]
MAEPAGAFHLLQAGPDRYLCYCRPGPGPGGTVYVTDALEVWAGELGARPPLGCRCQPEEHGTKLREALGRGAASLSLGEGKATLQLREEARCSALDLFKLPIAEARSQLQALVFGMAVRVESLERRLEAVETLASSCSPEKNAARSQQLFLPGRQLPGAPPLVPLLVCLLFPRRLLVPCPCALQDALSPLGCGCCQLPHCSGALPGTEGARAQRGGSRGVWDALCSGQMPGTARQVAR